MSEDQIVPCEATQGRFKASVGDTSVTWRNLSVLLEIDGVPFALDARDIMALFNVTRAVVRSCWAVDSNILN